MEQAGGLRALSGGLDPPPLRLFATVSGKGGVGKTLVAANLAVLAARAGRRVLTVDGDLGLANLEIALGIEPRFHIGQVLTAEATAAEVLATGPHGIRLLPAGSGLQPLTRLDETQRLQLVAALDELDAAFDLVVVDGPAGLGDNVLFFVGAAQEAILVLSAEPTSLADAYALVKVLSQRAGVRHFRVVVNPVADDAAGREVYDRLVGVTGRFLDASLRYLGHIPRDENVHRAIMARRPLVDLYPDSPASRALKLLATRLLGGAPPSDVDGGVKFMWQRLFREAFARAAR